MTTLYLEVVGLLKRVGSSSNGCCIYIQRTCPYIDGPSTAISTELIHSIPSNQLQLVNSLKLVIGVSVTASGSCVSIYYSVVAYALVPFSQYAGLFSLALYFLGFVFFVLGFSIFCYLL